MIGRVFARGCSHLIRSATNGLSTEISSLSKRSGVITPLSSFIRYNHHLGPQVQQPAPGFKGTAVISGDFKEIDLCDFRGKYLVLFFYPLDFTFVCPTEIIAFSDHIDQFKAINTEVVGVSCDSHFSHLAWINTPRKQGGLGELKYPLLADFNKTISRDYNVLLESEGVPLRGLFIIDPQGVVRQITVNDLPVGRSVDEVLRLVKAFQFTDKHGEEACTPTEEGVQLAKCTVPSIKAKSAGFRKRETTILSLDESEDTKHLSIAQLERLVLLDQLKVSRMQLEEFQSKRDQQKKEVKSSEIFLQERDCIAV